MIDNVSKAFDAGEVGPEHVEKMLALVYPDDEQERANRRERVMPEGVIIKFQLVALNKQATDALREARRNPVQPSEPEIPSEYLVDVPEEVYDNRGPDYVPEIKNRLGIIAAVRMYGKPQAKIRENRTEGIKVRCPFSFHEDNRPSAWVNTDKNTWYCGKCQTGGDVIDFYAAARHNLEPEQFHRSSEFRSITEEMAEALGIEVWSPVDTSAWASPLPDTPEEQESIEVPIPPDNPEEDPPIPDRPVVPPSSEAGEPITVTTDEMMRGISFVVETNDDDVVVEIDAPTFDSDRLQLRDDTFLHSWIEHHRSELPWVPSEYFMMLGLQAIGISTGHHVVSYMYGMPLHGALMMLLIGPSGYGKTTASFRLKRMMDSLNSTKFDPDTGSGVKQISSPASPEALIALMRTDIEDPMNATAVVETPTTAWLYEDEFATFMNRSKRQAGGHLKQRLMQFYDFAKYSSDPERSMDEYAVTGKTRRIVHDSFLSALFLAQPQLIRQLTDRSDLFSGFLNRMVPVFGKPTQNRIPETRARMEMSPACYSLYDDLWDKCHKDSTIGNPIVMPFGADAEALMMQHPYFPKTQYLGNENAIYTRLDTLVYKMALLLAVNEYAPQVGRKQTLAGREIEPTHVLTAIDLVSNFVQAGYTALVEAVTADEVGELAQDVISYLEGTFRKKGKWPPTTELMQQRFWRKYLTSTWPRAIEHLRLTKQIVEITLVNSKSYKQEITIATRGPWASYSNMAGKTLQKVAFDEVISRVREK